MSGTTLASVFLLAVSVGAGSPAFPASPGSVSVPASVPTPAPKDEDKDAWTRVPTVVIVAADNDPRLAATYAAIDYWNRTLEKIGTPFRLGTITRSSLPVARAGLENMSFDTDTLPADVRQQPGDLVIVLSDGNFVSFAMGDRAGGKVLVAIKDPHLHPLQLPNVVQNVIAHELGHAIGLPHNTDPTRLMCGRPAPCRPDIYKSDTARFFPLTDAEKQRLLGLYPVGWQSRLGSTAVEASP